MLLPSNTIRNMESTLKSDHLQPFNAPSDLFFENQFITSSSFLISFFHHFILGIICPGLGSKLYWTFALSDTG